MKNLIILLMMFVVVSCGTWREREREKETIYNDPRDCQVQSNPCPVVVYPPVSEEPCPSKCPDININQTQTQDQYQTSENQNANINDNSRRMMINHKWYDCYPQDSYMLIPEGMDVRSFGANNGQGLDCIRVPW